MTIQRKMNKNIDSIALTNFFKNYRKNMWIIPEIYDFLSELEKQGILQSYYELYCSNCQKSMGTVRLFNELPETFECELCHSELSSIENSFLIYMVVRDD